MAQRTDNARTWWSRLYFLSRSDRQNVRETFPLSRGTIVGNAIRCVESRPGHARRLGTRQYGSIKMRAVLQIRCRASLAT